MGFGPMFPPDRFGRGRFSTPPPVASPQLQPPGDRTITTKYGQDGASTVVPGYPMGGMGPAPRHQPGTTDALINALLSGSTSESRQADALERRPVAQERAAPVRQAGPVDDGMEEEWRRSDGAVVAPGTMGATMYRVPKGVSRNVGGNFPGGGGGGGGGGKSQSIGDELAAFAEGNKSDQQKQYEAESIAGKAGNPYEENRMAQALTRSNLEYAQRNSPGPVSGKT